MDIQLVGGSLPSYGDRNFVRFYEGQSWTSPVSFGVKTYSDYKLRFTVWDNTSSNYLSDILVPGQWYTVEIYVTLGKTNGTVDFWINGVKKLSLTGRNTGSAPWGKIAVGNYSGAKGLIDLVMDNLIVSNTPIPF